MEAAAPPAIEHDAAPARDAAPIQDTGPATDAGNAKTTDAGATSPGTCTPPNDIDQPAPTLAQTGCMDPTAPTQFAAKAIAYEVNSPLWSDGADKSRGLVLPQGGKIQVQADGSDAGKWSLPVGTVLLKSFSFDGKLVETRLFVHHDDKTWVGYSYQWDQAQTEATIVPDERRNVMFDTGKRKVSWNYPSRLDCMGCHNKPGGSSIGPETAQFNRVVDGKNQIDKLDALGAFEVAPAKPYTAALVLPYAGQLGSPPKDATIEARARSYLHANCGFCHRPDGVFSSLDLRSSAAFADTHLCNTTPMKGDVGVSGATNLKPEKPMESTVWLRMHAESGDGRMPQIGTYLVDDAGLQLIGDWITSIKSCP